MFSSWKRPSKGGQKDLEVGLSGFSGPAGDHNASPHDVEARLDNTNRPSSWWGTLKRAIQAVRGHEMSSDLQAEACHKSIRHQQAEPANVPATSTSDGFEIRLNERGVRTIHSSLEALNQCNGVQGLSNRLKTDLEKGITGHDDEILQRRQNFGSNTHPCKKGKSFWRFIWKATQFPPSLVITLAVVIKLLLRIKRKDIHDGWYEEGGIVLVVVLHIIVRASTEYWQSRQFEKFTEVIRGGKNVWVSIYDIVVGDIVPLKTGGLVPADGVLGVANSLKVDEHEITCSHDIVQKDDQQDLSLSSGSKLIEGNGKMLVSVRWIALSASLLVVLFASVACIVQLCKYFYGRTKNSDGDPMFIRGSTTADEAAEFVIKSLSFGIATIIVGVPVGLYLAVLLK